MSDFLKPRSAEQEETHWLSVSDLMAGLMVVFLFIAIALMRSAVLERDQIKEVAQTYRDTQEAIYQALLDEFEKDLPKWNAVIDKDSLTFTFNSPEILFARGKQELSEEYRRLLDDFFPRYMKVLNQYRDSISEVRIEGHTSSLWNSNTSATDAYFLNMELSQGRTRSVLEYVYRLAEVTPHQEWIKAHIAAVGLSSSRPVLDSNNQENRKKSRRVTFRVVSNADTRIKQILEIN